jgi:hypothetical protein
VEWGGQKEGLGGILYRSRSVPCQDVAVVVWPGWTASVSRRETTRGGNGATPAGKREQVTLSGEISSARMVDINWVPATCSTNGLASEHGRERTVETKQIAGVIEKAQGYLVDDRGEVA